MTSMNDVERNELVAAMRNTTPLARLTAGEVSACFDGLVDLGYDIVKRPAVVAPEPVKVETAPVTKTTKAK